MSDQRLNNYYVEVNYCNAIASQTALFNINKPYFKMGLTFRRTTASVVLRNDAVFHCCPSQTRDLFDPLVIVEKLHEGKYEAILFLSFVLDSFIMLLQGTVETGYNTDLK